VLCTDDKRVAAKSVGFRQIQIALIIEKMVRRKFNPKRRIRPLPAEENLLEALAAKVRYGGNPEHKRNPGDFGLEPPSSPRMDSTLCDVTGIFERSRALALLRDGVRRGLISIKERDGLPQNIWAVSDQGIPLEAQLENQATATYHGYPMPPGDPLGPEVVKRWESYERRIQN
jgi:hypothetical protein